MDVFVDAMVQQVALEVAALVIAGDKFWLFEAMVDLLFGCSLHLAKDVKLALKA